MRFSVVQRRGRTMYRAWRYGSEDVAHLKVENLRVAEDRAIDAEDAFRDAIVDQRQGIDRHAAAIVAEPSPAGTIFAA